MIDHYALHEIHNLTDRFELTDGVPKGVKPRYNITPTQLAPIIVSSGGKVELQMMNWGLVSQGAKDLNSVFRYKTHNVQSEKVFSKASWDTAIRSNRCIIPANGFYMIRRDNEDAYYFTRPDDALLGLAGFYTVTTSSTGTELQTFTLLTVESNEAMPLPFGRMPVILHTEDEASWIDPAVTEFSQVVSGMRPYEGATLAYRRITGDVRSAKNDSTHLIEPAR